MKESTTLTFSHCILLTVISAGNIAEITQNYTPQFPRDLQKTTSVDVLEESLNSSSTGNEIQTTNQKEKKIVVRLIIILMC